MSFSGSHPTTRSSRQRRLFWRRSGLVTASFLILGVAGVSLARSLSLHHAPAAPAVTNPTVLAAMRSGQHCDVLVVGGTPSGISAAIAAARRGAKVVLVEERPKVGGDITYAMLNMFDVPMAPKGQTSPVAHGIFGEIYNKLGVSFDLKKSDRLFMEMLAAEPNIELRTNTKVGRLYMDGDRLVGVGLIHGIGAEKPLVFSTAVDATNDATLAARAGAGYYIGREVANPDKRMQAAGLLFSVKNVDWKAVRTYVMGSGLIQVPYPKPQHLMDASMSLKTPGQPTPAPVRADGGIKSPNEPPKPKPGSWIKVRLGGMTGNYAWERGNMIADYDEKDPNLMILSINFGRQTDGTIVLNTLNILGVNGLDPASKAAARKEAMKEIPVLMAYLRAHMPGFEMAEVAEIAPELYIRETRHIQGYYSLKSTDVATEVRFPDRIAMCSYPLDLHPYTRKDTNPFGAKRYYYTMPLRSLVPRKVNGVFVASRSLSATYSAAGSCRVIPPTMASGEAAGAAAWLCGKEGITPRDMMNDSRWVKELQDDLRARGADIGDTYPKRPAPPSTRSEVRVIKAVEKTAAGPSSKIAAPA